MVVFPAGGISTSPGQVRPPARDGCALAALRVPTDQKSRATVPCRSISTGRTAACSRSSAISASRCDWPLIFKEVKARIGTTLAVEVGDPIAFEDLPPLPRKDLALELRRRTYALARRTATRVLCGTLATPVSYTFAPHRDTPLPTPGRPPAHMEQSARKALSRPAGRSVAREAVQEPCRRQVPSMRRECGHGPPRT